MRWRVSVALGRRSRNGAGEDREGEEVGMGSRGATSDGDEDGGAISLVLSLSLFFFVIIHAQ